MDRALYGPDGFYRARGGPAAHFRTSVHASPLFAGAVLRLLAAVDALLGSPARLSLVDVGAGGGELLANLHAQLAAPLPLSAAPDTRPTAVPPDLAERLHLVAVELADRPPGLAEAIAWRGELPTGLTGLVIANEWLDNVPCDVAQLTADGPRLIEVAPDGTERPGTRPGPEQRAWLEAWWPLREVGARAEIGLMRDAAWRRAAGSLERGVAVAIDYAHERSARPPLGTLTGYAHGRQVEPVPDGNCDLTAHVALDACAAAVPARWTALLDQRTALRRLGVTGARPDLRLAGRDPGGYLRALSRAGEAAELTDPAGLGGFGWLLHGIGTDRGGLLED